MSPHKTRGYLPAGPIERRSYRFEGAPMLFLAFGLLQAGINGVLHPTASSATSVALLLHGNLEPLEFFWQASYVLAGVLLFVGVLIPYPVAEVIGDWLAMWAMSINLIALLIVRGPGGTGAALGAFLLAMAVCAIRIYVIHERARLALVDKREHQDTYDGPERRRP